MRAWAPELAWSDGGAWTVHPVGEVQAVKTACVVSTRIAHTDTARAIDARLHVTEQFTRLVADHLPAQEPADVHPDVRIGLCDLNLAVDLASNTVGNLFQLCSSHQDPLLGQRG